MLLSGLILLLAQEPASSSSPPAPERAWKPFNAVRLIVNEEAVTTTDFVREFARRDQPLTTAAERDKAMADVANTLVERMLAVQAGKDLGFDAGLIDRLVRDEMDATVERVGSVVELGAALDEMDMDPQMLREDRRDGIYRRLWEGAVAGRSAGPGGRPHVDRYVRPSKLRVEYRRGDANQLVRSMITLEEIGFSKRVFGDAEKALAHAQAIHARLAAGEDFEALGQAEMAEQRVSYTVFEPRDLAQIQRTPVFSEFAKDPVVGKLSEPLPVRNVGELQGFSILRIRALDIPEPPRFESGAIQELLRKRLETRAANYLRAREIAELLRAAYVWPPEAFGRASAEPDAIDD